jgi:hypothetical protein
MLPGRRAAGGWRRAAGPDAQRRGDGLHMRGARIRAAQLRRAEEQ